MERKEWTKPEINFVTKKYKEGHSRRGIAKLFGQKFGYFRSSDSIQHCIDRNCTHIEKDIIVPKVLLLDIETSPIEASVWDLFDQNIPIDMINRDWFILSWSAKWIGTGEDEVFQKDQRGKLGKALANDKNLLKPLWKLMDEADIIIGHNLDRFDIPKLRARFFENGFDDTTEFKTIDTLKIASRRFRFTSNKLAYLTKKFCKKYKKLDHSKYSGYALWKEVLRNNKDAWFEMAKYNKYDVLSLEELFVKFAQKGYDKSEKTAMALRAYEAASGGVNGKNK